VRRTTRSARRAGKAGRRAPPARRKGESPRSDDETGGPRRARSRPGSSSGTAGAKGATTLRRPRARPPRVSPSTSPPPRETRAADLRSSRRALGVQDGRQRLELDRDRLDARPRPARAPRRPGPPPAVAHQAKHGRQGGPRLGPRRGRAGDPRQGRARRTSTAQTRAVATGSAAAQVEQARQEMSPAKVAWPVARRRLPGASPRRRRRRGPPATGLASRCSGTAGQGVAHLRFGRAGDRRRAGRARPSTRPGLQNRTRRALLREGGLQGVRAPEVPSPSTSRDRPALCRTGEGEAGENGPPVEQDRAGTAAAGAAPALTRRARPRAAASCRVVRASASPRSGRPLTLTRAAPR